MPRSTVFGFIFCLGWAVSLPSVARADDAQNRAIAAIRDSGGVVILDRERLDHPSVRVVTPLDAELIPHLAKLAELRELEGLADDACG